MFSKEKEANEANATLEMLNFDAGGADSFQSVDIAENELELNNKNEAGASRSLETKRIEPSQSLLYATYTSLVEALFKFGTPSLHLPMYAEILQKALKQREVSMDITTEGIRFTKKRQAEYIFISPAINIDKLVDVIHIVRRVGESTIECTEVLEKLEKIHERDNCFSVYTIAFIAKPLSAIGATVFFYGGNEWTILLSLILGTGVGILDLLIKLGYLIKLKRIYPFIGAIIPAFFCGMVAHLGWLSLGCAFASAFGKIFFYYHG
eukprot:Awhi_evm1s14118